jgi:hypothetical protein
VAIAIGAIGPGAAAGTGTAVRAALRMLDPQAANAAVDPSKRAVRSRRADDVRIIVSKTVTAESS